MMYSSTEYLYLKDLVNTYILKYKYKDYICTTVSYTDSNVDFICYFSKDNIVKNNDYQYSLSNYVYGIVDVNPGKSPMIEIIEESSPLTLSLNRYETIYSNVENTIHADLLSEVYYEKENDVSYNIDLNFMLFMALLLALPIIYGFTRKFFRIG